MKEEFLINEPEVLNESLMKQLFGGDGDDPPSDPPPDPPPPPDDNNG